MASEETNREKVDQILLGNGSLKELESLFPNQEAVLFYYAHRMFELFPPEKKTNECQCCHRHSAEQQVVFEWRGIYHTRTTAAVTVLGILTFAIAHHLFHFLMPSKQIKFLTSHDLCAGCFEQLQRRRMLAVFIKQLCLVLVVTSALVFASLIVFTLLFLLSQPTASAIGYTAIGFCIGCLCLTVGLCGADQIARWSIPESMRFIARPPFQLVGFQKRLASSGKSN